MVVTARGVVVLPAVSSDQFEYISVLQLPPLDLNIGYGYLLF
jgi:hypothetical protein